MGTWPEYYCLVGLGCLASYKVYPCLHLPATTGCSFGTFTCFFGVNQPTKSPKVVNNSKASLHQELCFSPQRVQLTCLFLQITHLSPFKHHHCQNVSFWCPCLLWDCSFWHYGPNSWRRPIWQLEYRHKQHNLGHHSKQWPLRIIGHKYHQASGNRSIRKSWQRITACSIHIAASSQHWRKLIRQCCPNDHICS